MPMRREQQNRFVQEVNGGLRPTAMWVTIPWSGVPEILGAYGVTAAFIDLQHVSHGLNDVQSLILASEVAGVTPLVRPTGTDREEVTRILDAGAHGVIFPEICTVEMAAAAVATMRFPPIGSRGWGGAHTRFATWSGGMALAELTQSADETYSVHNQEFLATAGKNLVCIVIVESTEGVENIEGIAKVQGIDGVVFGWGDFSVEVGFDVNQTREAADHVYQTCRQAGIGVAIPPGSASNAAAYRGCFSIVGVDSLLLSSGIRDVMRRI